MIIILVVIITSDMAMPMGLVTVIKIVVMTMILPSPTKAVSEY